MTEIDLPSIPEIDININFWFLYYTLYILYFNASVQWDTLKVAHDKQTKQKDV